MNKVRFKSTLTDMWGFGMLCLELMTGRVPFWTIQRERDVARHILNGSLPDIPEITSAGVTDNQLWRHVTSCWKSEPLERIPIAELRLSLSHLQTVSHTEEGFFYMDALDEVNPPHPENPHDEEFDESRPWSTTRLTKPLFSIKRRATL
ncbi:hypothetical protein NEOLEDRAFT_1103117 [Neolentinus lepideus HHB14362 ss-1]|uniref:Protein kinase domain-containing protein n=1 Tax=Neolentinus lepideus HHB14362 ss-1 TaxID=1314782 RepID=A0A165MTN2_9AGAM|nr:hypothetical protein NEOLEDRAFT_1103117 [Neolentinus lepideus HHB14362 ss-1]